MSVSADSPVNYYISSTGHQIQMMKLSMKWRICQAARNIESETHGEKRNKMRKTIYGMQATLHKV